MIFWGKDGSIVEGGRFCPSPPAVTLGGISELPPPAIISQQGLNLV
jgi:hypothetical protein